MPNAFNFSASPFDCLSPDEQRLVRDSVDVAYYREGETILNVGDAPTHLFVVIKGYVTQSEGDEIITTYGPDDCFDGRGLMAGRVTSRFVATEEVVAYQLAKQTVRDLIAGNATFGSLLFSDLSDKLSAISARKAQHEQQSLALAKVEEAFLRPAVFVDAGTDILTVVRLFQSERCSNVLVRDLNTMTGTERLGIFTATTLQSAVLKGVPLDQQPVGALASFPVVEIDASAQLGDAMMLMLSKRIHRLAVRRDGEIMGVLEALDLFSFLSNQSHLITVRIEEARDLSGLAVAAAQITRMIGLLYRSGSRVNLIAKLVQQLNARLFERAWHLIAPRELVENACLFVMGSEGRGEQLLKTDQDNGLILRDGYTPPDNLAEICQQFSDALKDFGYPECPGRIMVNNSDWCKSVADFAQMTRQWLIMPTPDSLMNLAIFMDAHAVSGDVKLLSDVQARLSELATDNDMVLSRFAAAMDAFGNANGWWNRLLSLGGDANQQLHLKKEGIFPLVHGVRSLALAHRLTETSTAERITALVQVGGLTPEVAGDLQQSLQFFLGLKLKAGLAELDTGKPVTGTVDVARLSSLDRDLLKDTLGVVKRFKQQLRLRFHLDALA